MAQEIFAAPRAEEMTKTLTGLAGGAVTGVVEGVIVKIAPQLGALETPFTWAALLGIPAIGAAGALFSRGMIGDLMQGVATAGTGIAAFVLPAMLMPEVFSRRAPATRQLPTNAAVKQLPAGPLGAPQRAQAQVAMSSLEF